MQNDWEVNWEDYYQILGVNADADDESIKTAYLNRCQFYHTDKMMGASDSAKQEAEELHKKTNRAYENLHNPEKRQSYDYEWKKRQRVESEQRRAESEPPVEPKASSEPMSRRTSPVYTNPTVRTDTKRMNTLSRVLIVLGIGLIAAGLILYFTKTIGVEVEYATLELQKAGLDTGLSWGNTNYYSEIQVKPIPRTEPDVHYLITIDNGTVNKEYEVSWTQLEIDIGKVKTISNKISLDEYTAYQMQPQFTVRFFELRPQHSVKYLIPGPSILIGLVLYRLRNRLRRTTGHSKGASSKEQYQEQRRTPPEPDPPEPNLEEVIINQVRQFEPDWREKHGKRILEGGENGNSANLAKYLRMNGTSNVETEETLAKGLRVDIVINNEVVLECKQDLKNSKTLKDLYGEIQRIKRLKRYTVYAVIYGDARRNLYEELCEEVGEYNVILLGKLRDSR